MSEKVAGQPQAARLVCEGVVARFGTRILFAPRLKLPKKARTFLLRSIKVGDELAIEEMWFTVGVQLERLQMREGDHIRFKATLTTSEDGLDLLDYETFIETPYRLSRPSNYEIVRRAEANQVGE